MITLGVRFSPPNTAIKTFMERACKILESQGNGALVLLMLYVDVMHNKDSLEAWYFLKRFDK